MWEFKNPSYGDQIRVNRGLYFHHGVYKSDDCVFEFAAEGNEISEEAAVVKITTLEAFLRGGNVEVRTYTPEELKKLRSKDEIISYAYEHLGERGYNIISNNCEHFSNRCAFGESKSDQVDNILNLLGAFFR